MTTFSFPRRVLELVAPSEIRLKLPYNFDRNTMYSVIDAALNNDLTSKAQKFVLDFSLVKFATPTAITVLSNLIEFLQKGGVKIRYENFDLKSEGNRYLDDSGFFRHYLGKEVFATAKLRKTTLPLELIRQDRSFSWIHNTFSPWMAARVGMSEESFGSIKLCLMEIFNNIADHSGQKLGCAFAQHYPKDNSVMLSISDFGVGIPFNVRKEIKGLSDSQAISQATINGFTTKSTTRNQGAGLAIMVNNVVQTNRGVMWINSLSGSLKCIHAASGVRKLRYEEPISYPGTLLEMVFRTDLLVPIVRQEKFEW